MYICPTCQRGFPSEEIVAKHSLKCWRETHPTMQSSSIAAIETTVVREMNNDIKNFFNSFRGGKCKM